MALYLNSLNMPGSKTAMYKNFMFRCSDIYMEDYYRSTLPGMTTTDPPFQV
jgi:hypothetical protein